MSNNKPAELVPPKGRTLQMTISGSGCAENGLDQLAEARKCLEGIPLHEADMDALSRWDLKTKLNDVRELDFGMAEIAIRALHDGLLAVAKGMVTPEQMREFFWGGETIADVPFCGGALTFNEKVSA